MPPWCWKSTGVWIVSQFDFTNQVVNIKSLSFIIYWLLMARWSSLACIFFERPYKNPSSPPKSHHFTGLPPVWHVLGSIPASKNSSTWSPKGLKRLQHGLMMMMPCSFAPPGIDDAARNHHKRNSKKYDVRWSDLLKSTGNKKTPLFTTKTLHFFGNFWQSPRIQRFHLGKRSARFDLEQKVTKSGDFKSIKPSSFWWKTSLVFQDLIEISQWKSMSFSQDRKLYIPSVRKKNTHTHTSYAL